MMNGTNSRKVLVLGIDGLDPGRIQHMVRAGELPSFAHLGETGTLTALSTSNPAESPVAWCNLSTGCDSGQHGIFDFIHRDPNTYLPRLSVHQQQSAKHQTGRSGTFVPARTAPGLWKYTSDAGLPTTVVRWPLTFPAEQVNGNFLSGLGVPDVGGRLGRHMHYTTAPVAKIDDKATHVTWKKNRIHTHLFGPEVSGFSGARHSRCGLTIEKHDSNVVLCVADQRMTMQCGQWSDWMHATFKWGPKTLCCAIVKFHLVSVEPELNLFATPLQIDPSQQPWPLTEPASYGAELEDAIGRFHTLGIPEDTHAVTEGRIDLDAFLGQCDDIDADRRRMFEHELNRFNEGLLAFVFDSGDRIQHMCWCANDPDSPAYSPELADRYGNVVPDLYRAMDKVVGRALEACGDDGALFVVSDHGFGPFHRSVNLYRWLIDNGYMTLKSSGEGRNLFADVDWSQTRAYALGFTSIYLNQRGRESKGIVEPGEDSLSLKDELIQSLQMLNDEEHGRPAVHAVYDAARTYHGPKAPEGPDLIVGFASRYRAGWQSALGGAPQCVISDNDSLWSGDHLVDPSLVPGVLATNIRVAGYDADGTDLAPSVLACLGLPIPAQMRGQPWIGEGGQTPASTEEPEHSDLEPVAAGVSAGDDGLDDAQRAELERRLSDLGYL